jgi:hypothetical protein
MKSLMFDHKTQIYVNDKEGLKIDHKYNNINITENTIDFNLKDNNRHVNIGDATAGQQAILGNHWMDWFDEFVDNLMGNNGGPYLGNLGAPVVTNPAMIQVLMKYKQLRDPVFLSHHVNIVDNNKVSTVRNTHREDNPQLGDAWNSTKVENNLTKKTDENFKPVDGTKPEYNENHVEPVVTKPVVPTSVTGATPGATGASVSSTQVVTTTPSSDIQTTNTNPPAEPLSSPTSNPTVDKMIKFLKSKGYTVYDTIGVLNIVAMQSNKKDSGEISNKFDDTLNIFFKNENGSWELLEYQITTMPGYVPKTTSLPMNVGFLALGQYIDQNRLDTYVIDNNSIPKKIAKCLKISECTIHINMIHKSSDTGSAENVYNYSGGAHVFKNTTQYDQFIDFCEKQIKISNKGTFTYTLCKNSEFENFVPVDSTIIDKVNQTTELPSNPSINWEVGKKVNSDILVDKNIKADWIITNDIKPGNYTSILNSTNGVDIKSETFTDTDLIKLEKNLREQALIDFNQLKVERG